MNSMRPVNTILLFGAWLGGIPACSSAIMNTPVSKTGEGWAVTISEIKEGPDEWASDGVNFRPDRGDRFFWAQITVKSELAEEETFSYDNCLLDGKNAARKPLIVDRKAEMLSAGDRAELVPPGQERSRILIYSFPKDDLPTRMRCGKLQLPLKWKR